MANDGLFQSIIGVIIGAFMSLVLIRSMGEIMDVIVTAMMNANMFDVTDAWASPYNTIISIMYFACYIPVLMSFIYAFMNVRRKTPEDVGGIQEIDYY